MSKDGMPRLINDIRKRRGIYCMCVAVAMFLAVSLTWWKIRSYSEERRNTLKELLQEVKEEEVRFREISSRDFQSVFVTVGKMKNSVEPKKMDWLSEKDIKLIIETRNKNALTEAARLARAYRECETNYHVARVALTKHLQNRDELEKKIVGVRETLKQIQDEIIPSLQTAQEGLKETIEQRGIDGKTYAVCYNTWSQRLDDIQQKRTNETFHAVGQFCDDVLSLTTNFKDTKLKLDEVMQEAGAIMEKFQNLPLDRDKTIAWVSDLFSKECTIDNVVSFIGGVSGSIISNETATLNHFNIVRRTITNGRSELRELQKLHGDVFVPNCYFEDVNTVENEFVASQKKLSSRFTRTEETITSETNRLYRILKSIESCANKIKLPVLDENFNQDVNVVFHSLVELFKQLDITDLGKMLMHLQNTAKEAETLQTGCCTRIERCLTEAKKLETWKEKTLTLSRTRERIQEDYLKLKQALANLKVTLKNDKDRNDDTITIQSFEDKCLQILSEVDRIDVPKRVCQNGRETIVYETELTDVSKKIDEYDTQVELLAKKLETWKEKTLTLSRMRERIQEEYLKLKQSLVSLKVTLGNYRDNRDVSLSGNEDTITPQSLSDKCMRIISELDRVDVPKRVCQNESEMTVYETELTGISTKIDEYNARLESLTVKMQQAIDNGNFRVPSYTYIYNFNWASKLQDGERSFEFFIDGGHGGTKELEIFFWKQGGRDGHSLYRFPYRHQVTITCQLTFNGKLTTKDVTFGDTPQGEWSNGMKFMMPFIPDMKNEVKLKLSFEAKQGNRSLSEYKWQFYDPAKRQIGKKDNFKMAIFVDGKEADLYRCE
ncbi:MAG: hypothetical protein J6Z49_05440 [Kiritimatiellae bacterium]|nr:hypothetical protein [Kiritimatiellia bacterium]